MSRAGLAACIQRGFRQRCGDAGLELLLGPLPTAPSLRPGASPPHLDLRWLTLPRQILTDFPRICCKARGRGWQAAVPFGQLPLSCSAGVPFL